MDEQGLFEALQAAIREETGQESVNILPSMTANDLPGWDSLAHVRIMFNVEERLATSINVRETYDAANIGELLEILKKQLMVQPR